MNDGRTASGEVVATFERDWRAGLTPSIEAVLARSGSDDASLLSELLAAEIRLRTVAGEVISRDEYLGRFPDHSDEIDRVLASAASATVEVPRPTGDTTPFAHQASETNVGGSTTDPGPGPPSTLPDVQRIGDYDLIEVLGRGGMGVVYKARQRGLDRLVALKMILSGELAGAEEIERFRTEAHAAARLDHPGIVPVHEVGEDAGRHYFSMAYVEGESLQHRVDRGAMSPGEIVETMRQLAEAVAYAHSRGVVHRDLKPHNVLLDSTGRARVTDFGLAKRIDVDDGLTQSGTVLGTAAYMSPEQARGDRESIGPRSDVYSLGAVLYCLLTGRPPFRGKSLLDTLQQVANAEPQPPSELRGETPSALEAVCLRCLRKEPSRRFESAADLAAALGGVNVSAPAPPSEVVNTPPSSRRWIGLVAAGGLAAVLAGFAISAAFRPSDDPPDDPTPPGVDPTAKQASEDPTDAPAVPDNDGPVLRYVGLGVNKYPWFELRFAQEDVLRLRETFESRPMAGRSVDAQLLGDPKRAEMLEALETLARRVDEDDLGIVAFSGIEIVADGKFYLLPSDVRAPGLSMAGDLATVRRSEERTLVRESAVSAADIAKALGPSRGRIVLFVDSCRAETLGRDLAAINPLFVTVASCRADEVSIETPEFGENGGGAFTSALVEGLEGKADVDGDRRVTLQEAIEFTIERTRETTRPLGNEQRPIVVGTVFDATLTERPETGER